MSETDKSEFVIKLCTGVSHLKYELYLIGRQINTMFNLDRFDIENPASQVSVLFPTESVCSSPILYVRSIDCTSQSCYTIKLDSPEFNNIEKLKRLLKRSNDIYLRMQARSNISNFVTNPSRKADLKQMEAHFDDIKNQVSP